MKQTVLWLAMIALAPQLGYAASGKITTNATTCELTTTCLTVGFGTQDKGAASLTLAGTWTGTVTFEATGDGGNTWSAISVTPVGSTTTATSSTANGTWQVNIAGLVGLRMRGSASMTGTAVATITLSGPSFSRNGVGTGSGDTITSPNGTLAVGGTALATTLDVVGATGKVPNGALSALTYTPTLGVPGTSAGTLTTANGSAAFSTTYGSAATANNTILGPAVVIPDQTMVGCSTASVTCTLIPMQTVSVLTPTTWTATAGTGLLGAGEITLLASQSAAKRVLIYWNAGQTVAGNCTTAGGTIQLAVGYKDKLTGLSLSPIVSGTNPVTSIISGTGAQGNGIVLQPGTTISRSGIFTAVSDLYIDSGVAVTYRANQSVAASGGTCDTFAQVQVVARVVVSD